MQLREAYYVHVLQHHNHYNLDIRSYLRLRYMKSYCII
jgi:hypothetical protein